MASAAVLAASPAAEPDRLFTLTPSRWLELDKECATFLHTALRYASGDQSKAVVIGNIEQMESAIKDIKVFIAEFSSSASFVILMYETCSIIEDRAGLSAGLIVK